MEAADLATVCRCKGLYPEAARRFEDALALDPTLATAAGILFETACTQARAAAAPGEDAARWRRAALGSVRAYLAANTEPREVARAVRILKRTSDLAGVRDRIDDLPADERGEWRRLWADADALLARAVEALR